MPPKKKTSRKRSPRKKKSDYYAVVVVVTPNGRTKTLGHHGKSKAESMAGVVSKAAKYGTIASIGVYKDDKEIYYVEYPIIRKIRVKR